MIARRSTRHRGQEPIAPGASSMPWPIAILRDDAFPTGGSAHASYRFEIDSGCRRGSEPAADPSMQILQGIAVSSGIAIAPVLVIDPRGPRLPQRLVASGDVASELLRLEKALKAAQASAEAGEHEARKRLGPQYADILGAHARMISDPTLRHDARLRIERDHLTAEHSVHDILEELASRLEAIKDKHLAGRAVDVRDILQRILLQLGGDRPDSPLAEISTPCAVLAPDLTPSETAGLNPQLVMGFATESGGRASHTAIVAEALEIPAVVGLGRFLDLARNCHEVIIDGDKGIVILDPDAATLAEYRDLALERARRFEQLAKLAPLPAVTNDDVPVHLWGNIEFADEVGACLNRGAEGVGLYRTDFLYLNRDLPPSEDEQFAAYEAVVRSMAGRPVIIRTLDLGADKIAVFQTTQGSVRYPNPALGLRSLRLSLREPGLFRTQLRALLRAGALGDLRVMFPLVTTVNEVREARVLLKSVASEMAAEGIVLPERLPQVGMMVEVPAAAIIADKLAKEVDFFSIGTNDLTQYALAVDRTDETVADIYSAADPAVIRLIAMVVAAGESHKIPVSVCGTMGGDPVYTMLLVGLGLRNLSMAPHQLPEVKRVIRGISLETARQVAAEALCCDTAAEVLEVLNRTLRSSLPDVVGGA